jgi:signal transduction histidine kinase
VNLAARLDEESGIIVSLSDDGPGIPQADLPYLGDRFYRGGDINTRPRGLGLGLALANDILALHGSSLEIESREGAGATFTFRLPDLDRRRDLEVGALPGEVVAS